MIVIIGAGLTGLALAHELAGAGTDFLLLEATPEPGGVIRSIRVDGRVLELGPQRGRLSPPFLRFVEELDLAERLLLAPSGLPLFIYARGRLRTVPFSLRHVLRGDLLPWSARFRALLEPLAGPARPDESVADFLSRHFGATIHDELLGPLYGGLFASDPRDMLVRYTLRETLASLGIADGSLLAAFARRSSDAPAPPACSFIDGMQELPGALHERHHARIRLNTPARAIAPDGDAWRVETEHDSIRADHVVLTTPADIAAALLRPHAPGAADRLQHLHYNRLAMVHLLGDCHLHGFGYQVSFREPLHTRGVTFNASLFGRDGVYTAFLGGARDPALADQPDDRIGDLAAREFRHVTGCNARVLHVSRPRIPAWDRSWCALEGLELPRGIHLAANYESRVGIPGRFARARQLAARLA
jgi:oxygen-dependent protoporphyrinogen oxidase